MELQGILRHMKVWRRNVIEHKGVHKVNLGTDMRWFSEMYRVVILRG